MRIFGNTLSVINTKDRELTKKFDLTVKSSNQNFKQMTLSDPHCVAKYARNLYGASIDLYENVYAIFLNQKNRTIGYAKIAQGGISSSVADARIVCKYAIDILASGVIIVHNHPSGIVIPSKGDIKWTSQVKDALNMINVKFVDHIIISSEFYYSFACEKVYSDQLLAMGIGKNEKNRH